MLLLGAAFGLALAACFTGEGTIGAICTEDTQCGLDQACRTGVCGLCKDGEVQPGELCFGPSSEELAFGEVTDLFTVDYNRDGAPELAAIINDDCGGLGGQCWNIRFLVPDLDGDFESFVVNEGNVPGYVPKATTGNFDGNGVPDILLVVVPLDPTLDPSQLAVLSDFPDALTSIDIDVVIHARSLEAADLDGNGFDDILISAEEDQTLVLIPSTGSGFGQQRVLISDPAPRLTTPVDMDGDGDLDLVIGSAFEGTVGVDLNDGDANFTPQPRVTLGSGPVGIAALTTADFDGDGTLDVAAIALPPDESGAPILSILRGLGNGMLEPLTELPGGELPIELLAEDINADGLVDLMVADLLEDRLPVFLNRGGSFPDVIGVDVAAAPASLLRADFDFDDVPDLVVGNANGVISIVRSEN